MDSYSKRDVFKTINWIFRKFHPRDNMSLAYCEGRLWVFTTAFENGCPAELLHEIAKCNGRLFNAARDCFLYNACPAYREDALKAADRYKKVRRARTRIRRG